MIPIKGQKKKHAGEFLMPKISFNSPLFMWTFIKQAFIESTRARETYFDPYTTTKLKQPTGEENA